MNLRSDLKNSRGKWSNFKILMKPSRPKIGQPTVCSTSTNKEFRKLWKN